MNAASVDAAALWADAALATALFATDPFGLGGLVLRAGPGPARDTICAWVRALLPPEAPVVRVPLHVTVDRLLGGLSLADTLRTGRLVTDTGLLAAANGGAVVVAMAERLEPHVTSHLCAALDRGELALERDGLTGAMACRLGVVALDEGLGDERPPAALRDRLALHVDLTALAPRSVPAELPEAATITRARALLPAVVLGDDVVRALCEAAVLLGIPSLRAPLLAVAVARAHAALAGRTHVDEADAAAAARLVLGPRATCLPQPIADDTEEELSEPEPPGAEDASLAAREPETRDDTDAPTKPDAPLEDVVLAAAKSAIPAGVLELLALGVAPRSAARSAGRAGELRGSTCGGRPTGTRPGFPRTGERLNLVETLRAAAPWQRLRRPEQTRLCGERRVLVRKDDLRVTRFRQRSETNVVFAVDASGSAALQRLAEAKGAVEQVLGDCYVRRDHVALVAFRGTTATLLLPPTRSLARVRRSLADLAGGGTTPLAAGIDAALALALEARKRGQTPVMVLMTDGRANIARDGREGGAAATTDALACARAVRAAGVRALFLDTAPRPREAARALAAEMAARYLPLPYLDALGISRQVKALAGEAT
jgi:magnesium chelatase subunit D